MGDLVNLNRARKAKQRAADTAQAAANRLRHGRTKAERAAQDAQDARAKALLDGARKEDR